MRQLLSAAASMAVAISPLLQLSAVQAAPATDEDMELYSSITAINACVSMAYGTEFKKAIAISGDTLAETVRARNEGAIAAVGDEPLPQKDLREGSVRAILIGVLQLCPDRMPDDAREKLQEALQQEALQQNAR